MRLSSLLHLFVSEVRSKGYRQIQGRLWEEKRTKEMTNVFNEDAMLFAVTKIVFEEDYQL